MPGILSLHGLFQDVCKTQRQVYYERHQKEAFVDHKVDAFIAKSEGREETSGDKRLRALINALEKCDTLGYKRSEAQRLFHKAYIAACLKKIYGKDIHKDVARLLVEYDLDELRSDVIVTTPRRRGKTVSVAIFVACYLITQPDCEISIYSTGRRASKKLLAQIHKIVLLLSDSKDIVKTYNVESLEIKGTGFGLSKCHSYPSKVQIDILYEILGVGYSFIIVFILQSRFIIGIFPSLSLSLSLSLAILCHCLFFYKNAYPFLDISFSS